MATSSQTAAFSAPARSSTGRAPSRGSTFLSGTAAMPHAQQATRSRVRVFAVSKCSLLCPLRHTRPALCTPRSQVALAARRSAVHTVAVAAPQRSIEEEVRTETLGVRLAGGYLSLPPRPERDARQRARVPPYGDSTHARRGTCSTSPVLSLTFSTPSSIVQRA